QVAALVVPIVRRPFHAPARPQQAVVLGQMRALLGTRFGTDDVLPPAVAQEAMIPARNELRPVLQFHLPRRLDARPLREHLGLDESAVPALALSTDDVVADRQIFELAVAPVGHQDERAAPAAIEAGMGTPP